MSYKFTFYLLTYVPVPIFSAHDHAETSCKKLLA